MPSPTSWDWPIEGGRVVEVGVGVEARVRHRWMEAMAMMTMMTRMTMKRGLVEEMVGWEPAVEAVGVQVQVQVTVAEAGKCRGQVQA